MLPVRRSDFVDLDDAAPSAAQLPEVLVPVSVLFQVQVRVRIMLVHVHMADGTGLDRTHVWQRDRAGRGLFLFGPMCWGGIETNLSVLSGKQGIPNSFPFVARQS